MPRGKPRPAARRVLDLDLRRMPRLGYRRARHLHLKNLAERWLREFV